MEGIEEPSLQRASEEGVKDNSIEVVAMNVDGEDISAETDVCHTSNGVPESEDVGLKSEQQEPVDETTVENDAAESATEMEDEYVQYENATDIQQAETNNPEYINEFVETEITAESFEPESTITESVEDNNISFETEVIEESVEVDGIVENSSANISFETEIFIESNSAEIEAYEEPDSSNILSELGQNIELSEVLRSADGSEPIENNNCEQEVFNKEELLNILEGNDTEQSRKVISENFLADSKKLEEHLAMQQLNRLKVGESKKRSRHSPKKPEKKQPKRNSSQHASKEKVEEPAILHHEDPVDDTTTLVTSSKETRSKVVAAKEMKAKANATSTSQNTSKDVSEKVDETNDTQNDSKEKRKVAETKTSQNTSKGAKRKVNELNNSQNISKDATEISNEVTETVSVQNVPKDVKGKAVDKINSNKTPSEAKSKAKDAKPKKESIINSLVQDWSDDEPNDHEPNKVLDESQNLPKSTEEVVVVTEIVVQKEAKPKETEGGEHTSKTADISVNDELTPNRKSADETQPQRRSRESRVIKKKVIYDPDNPDTFTKTNKVQVKKEKDPLPEKDMAQVTPKKVKTDQSPQVVKTKSPPSKMQWKKPQPKSNRQSHRRLTEIDKLLMDEGAVNMICQLTPEALKGNKNMKSKAEFIKNIQSNTPDTKEMKFRERKSKVKTEEHESKKHGGSKQRLSVGGSIKSPAVSEDFENHSADDSIIYRRHSSSSYSSSCMSPRRLSDVDGGSSNQSAIVPQIVVQEVEPVADKTDSNLFMAEKITPKRESIMNKSDCLSIKEKLNSKLSLALNKRKLSSFSLDKPAKVKKVVPPVEEVSTDVTVNFNQKVAEICIRKAGSLFNVQIMRVLQNILLMVDSNKDTNVTLITSESGNLCSGLDLKPIVGNGKHDIARDIADHARLLMQTLENHSKLIVIGVEGKIQGFSLALAALGDVLLASETTTFSLAEGSNSVMHPGAAVLNSRALSQELVNELIVFGRELSASEALRGGLISRVIWPERFQQQVRAIAMDIATQPYENVKLKKQLLSLKKESPSTFQACLDKERDLLVNYWTSEEGMNLLRARMDPA